MHFSKFLKDASACDCPTEARGEEDAIEISSEASAGGNDPEGASASPNIDDKIQLDVWSKNVTSILSEARLILSSLRSRGGGRVNGQPLQLKYRHQRLQTDLLNSAAIIACSGRSCIKSMADDSQERSILA